MGPLVGTPLSRILAYERQLVCIARFNDKYAAVNGIPREAEHVFYQIIVDPNAVSGSRNFIEFAGPGQQIFGWKPLDAIDVYEILGEVADRASGTLKAFDQKEADAAVPADQVETLHQANMADMEFHLGTETRAA